VGIIKSLKWSPFHKWGMWKAVKEMYAFNLLVSCSWGDYGRAKEEIFRVLRALGDENPLVRRTFAEGIIGVKTCLDSREVVHGLRRLFDEDPSLIQHTLKWVPVDLWTYSDMESMKKAVTELGKEIEADEKWRMTVEKRRYTQFHKIEIIRELAELIDRKVDLENPDKIVRIDIIGKYAGLALLKPQDIFSTSKSLL